MHTCWNLYHLKKKASLWLLLGFHFLTISVNNTPFSQVVWWEPLESSFYWLYFTGILSAYSGSPNWNTNHNWPLVVPSLFQDKDFVPQKHPSPFQKILNDLSQVFSVAEPPTPATFCHSLEPYSFPWATAAKLMLRNVTKRHSEGKSSFRQPNTPAGQIMHLFPFPCDVSI